MNKKIVLTIICAIYLVILLIGAFTAIPGSASDSLPGADKGLHFVGFFVLTILLIFTFRNYTDKRVYLKSLAAAIAVGIIIEAVQLFIPARTFSWLDIAADLGGIFLGMVLAWTFSKL